MMKKESYYNRFNCWGKISAKILLIFGILLAACYLIVCSIIRKPAQQGSDCYWDAPQKTFEERRIEYLEYCATNTVEGRKSPFNQIARLELGKGPLDEDVVKGAIDFIYSNKDCNDFTVGGFLRLLYRYPNSPLFSNELKKEIEKCLLEFKYWWDEPGKDRRCYHTENHQIIFHADELLAGQLFKDRKFTNDEKTGKEHMQHALLLIERWMDFRIKFGFSEWLSNNYFDADFMALANLYDFAEDPEIRARAGLLMDVLMFEMALHNYKGVFGTTHGRAYANRIKGGRLEPSSNAMKMFFGVGVFNSPEAMGAISLATSSYRCPEIIQEIATDYRKTVRNQERHSINLVDAPKYGLSFENELDCHLYWSIQDYANPNVLALSQQLSRKYSVRQHEDYESYVKRYDQQIQDFGEINNPDLDYHALTEVNIETYRTPDYLLSCAQDYRPGRPGYQQHIWQATLGIDAVLFTNHPASDNESSRPNYWAGNGIMPRAVQYKNVLASIHHVPANDPFPFSHAYFPKKSFDEVIEKGNWIFARKSNGYIALYSQNPKIWKKDDKGQTVELRVDSPDNIWLVEMGSKSDWKDFSNFVEAVSSSEIECRDLSLIYHSPSVGHVKIGWDGPLQINGKKVNYKYKRFENPYCQSEFTFPILEIRNKNKKLVLDFEKNVRVES